MQIDNKTAKNLYPNLYHFFGNYLHEDWDIIGDTIEEIVNCYKSETSKEEQEQTIEEIKKITQSHPEPNELTEIFLKYFGPTFDAKLWGYKNTHEFFEDIKKILI